MLISLLTAALFAEIVVGACIWILLIVWNSIVREKLQIKDYRNQVIFTLVILLVLNVWAIAKLAMCWL